MSFLSYLTDRKPVPFVYPEITKENQFTNVLLIDNSVNDYQTFVESVNSSTFPIVYSIISNKTELLTLLQANFTSISRIGIVFSSSLRNMKMFLDGKSFFNEEEVEPYSENVQFILNVLKEFRVKNIDYLACDTLIYSNWKKYYSLLTQETGVIVGASNDKTGNIKHGGDWIMESTSQNIELLYFTKRIEYYQYLLDNNPSFITGLNRPTVLAILNNVLYVANDSNNVQTYDATTGGVNANFITGIINQFGLAILNNVLYVANGFDNSVQTYNATTGGLIDANFITSGLNSPSALAILNNVLYVANTLGNNVKTYNATSGAVLSSSFITTGLSSPRGLAILNNVLYVASSGNNIVNTYDATSGAVLISPFITTGLNNPRGLAILNNVLYVSNFSGNNVQTYNATTGGVIDANFITGLNGPFGLAIFNNSLYVANTRADSVGKYDLPVPPAPPIVCFKEGSKILTDQGYKLIQDLRKGDLVKTLNHGFKPIHLIGKREIHHPALKERIKDQLYQCSQQEYEEVFEPLIITGCHSILVDDFVSNEQREKVIEVNGNTYVTDRKYRLPACADPRASVYEIPGNYTIYHLALENDDYYMNYGIYANGLLVETCSKRYLKELSNMELIE
jgi:hypothetical protein